MSEMKRVLTLPFGDLSKERGKDRLFTIGVALGFMLGLVFPFTGWAKITALIVSVLIITIRTTAQYRYPDRDVPRA